MQPRRAHPLHDNQPDIDGGELPHTTLCIHLEVDYAFREDRG